MTHVARKRPVKWFQVGIQLQIDMPILEAYDTEYSNHIRLFAKVFEQWRREETLPYTWNTIVTALERVDEHRIATDIIDNGSEYKCNFFYFVSHYTLVSSIMCLCIGFVQVNNSESLVVQ